jgi:exodeoxyribonuclease V alpha subunit
MGIDQSQIQVLTPTRKREIGTARLNIRLQAALNPPGKEKEEQAYGDFVFRTGDKVMQIKNNYDIIWKSLMAVPVPACINGDIGRISKIDHHTETMTIDYGISWSPICLNSLAKLNRPMP